MLFERNEEQMSKELEIGEVVYNNDIPMVVIDVKIYEDMGSCSYDRKYKICTLEELKDKDFILDDVGMWINIKGVSFPDIKRVEDIPPFEIRKCTSYRVRQKQAKTVTVYE